MSGLSAGSRVRLMAAVLLLGGCANQTLPPGGPPDDLPPEILSMTPANGATLEKARDIEIRFDEVISESPRGGGRDLRDLVFISPRSGTPRVSWQRSRIVIRPSTGWKTNTIYTVQIKPGIQDLRNNGIDSVIRLVFSTGGPIPMTKLDGVVFDWAAGKGLPNAVVEVIPDGSRGRDTTFYQAVADSAGRYTLEHLPPGLYLLRAFGDRNSSRTLDPLELWDSTSISLEKSNTVDLYSFGHDTVGLRISDIAVQDSNRTLKVTFDKPYATDQPIAPAMAVIKRPDSSLVRVRFVRTAGEKNRADSLASRMKADSAARAAMKDSTPAMRQRADSISRVKRADSVAAVQRSRQDAIRTARARGQRPPVFDTLPLPRMSRPRVFTEMYIALEEPLPLGTQFRLQMNGIVSLTKVVKSPSRPFSTPKPEKKDSTQKKS